MAKINIDWDVVRAMLYAYNDAQDIADHFGVDADTITRRYPEENDGESFRDAKARCRASTRQRLRAAQIKKALGTEYETEETSESIGPFGTTTTTKKKKVVVLPDTSMLIFLGKNLLGQTDKADVTQEVKNFHILGDAPEGAEDLDD